jgi:nitroreductase
MDFQDVVRKRRSIRHFLDRDVPDEMILKMLDAARWAPTGGNLQPWEFIIIRNKNNREKLVSATYIGYMAKTGKPQRWILEAPVIIATCVNMKRAFARYGSGELTRTNVLMDGAAAIENLLLTAVDLGLAACWVSGFDQEEMAAILKIPEGMKVLALIPVGYSDRIPGKPPRLDPEDFTYYESYGRLKE